MTQHLFGRIFVAALLCGVAVPAAAQTAPAPAPVEMAPLPPLGDANIDIRPLSPVTDDFVSAIEALLPREESPPEELRAVEQAPAPDPAFPHELTPPPELAQEDPPTIDDGFVEPTRSSQGREVFDPADRTAVAATPADFRLREAVTLALEATGGSGGFVEKRRSAAIEGFYEQRDNEPAWVTPDGVTARAVEVLDRLQLADTDGLVPAALGIPQKPATRSPGDLAAFELALSRAVVAFAEEASAGRVEPSKINNKFITRKPERLDPIASLTAVARARNVAAVMEGFNPPHAGFRRLKEKLAEVRGAVAAPPPEPIPDGKSLRPGMSDPRVVALRDRLGLDPEPDPILAGLYDDAVVEAVKSYQASAGLVSDGIIGPRTLAVLNGVDRDEAGQMIANMEMWRWMPRELGSDHVFVNIPEFMVRVIRHDRVTHEARVIVGTQVNQTPVFSDEMEYIVVNPYWHVPESIRMKEMLPEIQADPAGYFRRHGYEAVWNGQVIDPASVLWDENAVKYVAIRQPPSERNALGRIKFMFPNQHAVYLHDTPTRKLFGRDWRSFSHGCVRVDDPMRFAGAILEGEPNLTVGKLESMFGGSERRVDLDQHIKVHLAYFNVWVDEAGTLHMRDDLYGHTGKVKKTLDNLAAATQ